LGINDVDEIVDDEIVDYGKALMMDRDEEYK
jgi:hypothetical protein